MPEQPLIDVSPEDWRIVHDILQRYVPGREVWAFGSRAKWTAKEYSDLDIAIVGEEPLSLSVMAELMDAFQESELPFKVDVVDWATVQPSFRRAIESSKVVVKRRSGNLPMADIASAGPGAGSLLYVRSNLRSSSDSRALGDLMISFDRLRQPVKESDRRSGPFPYYGASGVVDNVDQYIFDGEYLLVAEDGENLRTRQLPIAFIATGKFWVNNHVHVIQANAAADTRYLMYALQRAAVAAYLTGSTMPKLTASNLARIPIPYRPLEEQRAIAGILGALDDKIELNRKMSETLEAMARALFKSWFIDFDPVRAKVEGRDPGSPPEIAALFPDSFENSNIGEIPKGWMIRSLPEAVDVNPTTSLSATVEAPYLDMANVPTRGYAINRIISRAVSSGSRFRNGDTLLARITPCLENGKTAFVDFLNDGQVGWGSTEFIVLRPRMPLPAEYGYLLARSDEFRSFAIAKMTGSSGRQRIPVDAFSSYFIALPPGAVLSAFSSAAKPAFKRISVANQEARTLSLLRDSLLPKLISGEIRVPEAERIVEKAI